MESSKSTFAARKALSIDMSNSNVDMLDLVEKLEKVLSLLDEGGHALAAIKVEEAINALQRADNSETKSDE